MSILIENIDNSTTDQDIDLREAAAPEYIRSCKELTQRLGFDTEETLDLLELAPSERLLVRTMMKRDWPRNVLNNLILTEYIGGRIEHYTSVLDSFTGARSSYDQINAVKEGHPFRGQIDSQTDQDVSFRFFPCEVRNFPAQFTSSRQTTSFRSMVFGMRLSDQEWQQVVENLSLGPIPRMQDTFGYIRYVQKSVNDKETTYILEYRNDIYERLTDNELKEKYRDWDIQLLHAFEGFMRGSAMIAERTEKQSDQATETEATLSTEIVFPSLYRMERRWGKFQVFENNKYSDPKVYTEVNEKGEEEHFHPGIPRRALKRLFRELPLDFGYKEVRKRGKDRDFIYDGQSMKFRFGLRKQVDFEAGTYEAGPIRIESIGFPRAERWIALRNRLFSGDVFFNVLTDGYAVSHPRNRSFTLGNSDITDAIQSAFEIAPCQTFEAKDLRHLTPSLREYFAAAQSSNIGQRISDVTPAHFTLVSKGIDQGSFRNWWELPQRKSEGWEIIPVHLPEQNRHPSLRFVQYDASGKPVQMFASCTKGGGLGHLDPDLVSIDVVENDNTTLPIYRRRKDQNHYSTHRYWGGMTRSEAEGELATTLGAHQIVGAVDPSLSSLLPLPLGVHKILSLPRWQNGETLWEGTQEYVRKYLGESNLGGGFATLQTATTCDVRISQLVKRIFGSHSPKESNERVKDAISFLYWVNGFEADLSGLTSNDNSEMHITAKTLRTLRQIAELNPEQSRELQKTIAERTLKLIGLVHGANGTLGGGELLEIGAPYGGPLTVRNMNLTGGLHDIDTCCFFPWLPENFHRLKRDINNLGHIKRMQAFDLLYWGESMYWLHTILNGDSASEARGSVTISLLNKHDITILQSNDTQSKRMRRLADGFRKEKYDPLRYIQGEELRTVYQDYRDKGLDYSLQS